MGRCEVTNDTCLQGAGARFTLEHVVLQAVSAVSIKMLRLQSEAEM